MSWLHQARAGETPSIQRFVRFRCFVGQNRVPADMMMSAGEMSAGLIEFSESTMASLFPRKGGTVLDLRLLRGAAARAVSSVSRAVR